MSNKITEAQKNKAITTYATFGTITKAAEACGSCRMTLYEEMKRSKEFKQAMTNAKQEYIEGLEAVLDHRIKDDKDKASAILLMFKLKKEDHDYRDKVEHKVDAEVTIISGVPRPNATK